MATLAELENAARVKWEVDEQERKKKVAGDAAKLVEMRAEAKTRVMAWLIDKGLDDLLLSEYLTVSNEFAPGNSVGAKINIPGHNTILMKARWVADGDDVTLALQQRHTNPWVVERGGTWPVLGEALMMAKNAYERDQKEAQENERLERERCIRHASVKAQRECLEQARLDLALELVTRYPALLSVLKLLAAYIDREEDASAQVETLENRINEGWAAASRARQDADDQASVDQRTIRDLEYTIWELERED